MRTPTPRIRRSDTNSTISKESKQAKRKLTFDGDAEGNQKKTFKRLKAMRTKDLEACNGEDENTPSSKKATPSAASKQNLKAKAKTAAKAKSAKAKAKAKAKQKAKKVAKDTTSRQSKSKEAQEERAKKNEDKAAAEPVAEPVAQPVEAPQTRVHGKSAPVQPKVEKGLSWEESRTVAQALIRSATQEVVGAADPRPAEEQVETDANGKKVKTQAQLMAHARYMRFSRSLKSSGPSLVFGTVV